MQTIAVPYTADADSKALIASWRREWSRLVRTGYANATGRSEKELRDMIKTRFPNSPLGSWAAHCAAREGIKLRRQRPDGRMVFGSRANLERRRKDLISKGEWRTLRLRDLAIVGDRTCSGNRHFRLSADALNCRVSFLERSGNAPLTLHLAEMSGNHGELMRAVALLAEAGEISVQFALGERELRITFDPMDLRRLASGQTLAAAKAANLTTTGKKPRGRTPTRPIEERHAVKPLADGVNRPVHPEWRDAIPTSSNRAIGLDLNPEFIGITVIEVGEDATNADHVRILDHRLHRIQIPINGSREEMAEGMGRIATQTISLARAWGASTIFHEEGLGKLAWSKRSKAGAALQTVNYWSRNMLLNGLARRCALSGLAIKPIWGGYSTTIGNMLFPLPDACAAAIEIARRGIASSRGHKDRLPAVPPRVHLRRWKDGDVPEAMAKAIADATFWQTVHRAIKPSQGRRIAPAVGYRRPHPPLEGPGRLVHLGIGYAVRRQGRKSGGLTTAVPIRRRPETLESGTLA